MKGEERVSKRSGMNEGEAGDERERADVFSSDVRIGWSNQSPSILIDGLWVKLPVKGRHEVRRYTGPVNRAGFLCLFFFFFLIHPQRSFSRFMI